MHENELMVSLHVAFSSQGEVEHSFRSIINSYIDCELKILRAQDCEVMIEGESRIRNNIFHKIIEKRKLIKDNKRRQKSAIYLSWNIDSE